jgi:hypothetical protein
MTSRFFELKSRGQVALHDGTSWTAFRGLKSIASKFGFSKDRTRLELTRLWTVNFILSLLAWSFVLSGLTMQIESGFKAGNNAAAQLLGLNGSTFDSRTAVDLLTSTYQGWRNNLVVDIPLRAAIYSSPGSKLAINTSTPNTLPSNASSEIFLTPQSTVPITGDIWGVILKYSCSIVEELNEFTVLNRRINSSNPDYVADSVYNNVDIQYYYNLSDGFSISVLSQQWDGIDFTLNVNAYAEIGLSAGFASLLDPYTWGYAPNGYETSTYAGLATEEVLELALWQSVAEVPGKTLQVAPVQNPIPELRNEHHSYESDYPVDPNMEAIGVRCVSSSVTGVATVNGFDGTFTDFQREDPYDLSLYGPAAVRFSTGVPYLFLQPNSTGQSNISKIPDLYLYPMSFPSLQGYAIDYQVVNTAWNWLAPLYVVAQVHENSSDDGLIYYDSLMQASDLQTVVLEAYKHYAVQLMFYGAQETWSDGYTNAGVPWTLLQAGGGVPPVLIVVGLLIWALGCAFLSAFYGFRKRWADTVSDYYLHSYCKEKRHNGLDYKEVLTTPH